MSQRQKQAHQAKEASRERYYPEFNAADLEARMNIAHAFTHLVEEELQNLLATTKLADDAKAMRGAHLTIAHYIGERLLAELSREREIVGKEADIVRIVSPGLVDAAGNPLGGRNVA